MKTFAPQTCDILKLLARIFRYPWQHVSNSDLGSLIVLEVCDTGRGLKVFQ